MPINYYRHGVRVGTHSPLSQETRDVLEDLLDRCDHADRVLSDGAEHFAETLESPATSPYLSRLDGKCSGVRLVRSYIEEVLR